jgi:ABC-type multidrug transport system fused ATPase/permease subunit
MRIRPDVDDIQTTRTEKLLAVVLTAFLLLGGLWTYQKLDDVVRDHVAVPTFRTAGPASQRLGRATIRENEAEARRSRALENLELTREAYRTALEAHEPAARLKARYEAAQRELADADRELASARNEAASLRPAAEREQLRLSERIETARDRQERYSFFSRLGLTFFYIGGAYALLAWMRRRTSRWFPLAGSAVAAATILAFVFAADYLTDYLDPFDWGIAAIAGVGIAATLLVYWGVQRYLIRRIPQRRVKRRQCPFCGYPLGDNVHCEGCGREVVAPCARCEAPRRVGTAYCAVCGSASG